MAVFNYQLLIQRKMLAYNILIRTTGGAHKAPYLYKFDEERYQKALQDGLNAAW